MKIHYTLLALLIAAGTADAAETGLVALEWSSAGAFAHEAPIPAGKFIEVCGRLPAAAQVAWQFEAGAPVDFNIHFHEGKKVSFPEKKDTVAQSSGVLNAKVEQDYCWMWSNKGPSAATLKLELQRR